MSMSQTIFITLSKEEIEQMIQKGAQRALDLHLSERLDVWASLPEMMPTKDAANALKISVSTLRAKVKEGLIEQYRQTPSSHPLFRKEELKAFWKKFLNA